MHYRAEIDGLRAFAVIPVILFHAGFEQFGGGFIGVDIFFVISGYLITTLILSDLEEGKFCIVNFYERRARRILPALFVVMLACLPFAWLWLMPVDMKSFSQSLVAVSAFASNVLFWQTSGYFETGTELKPLLHTWSLAVEEQYYLFFPIFLMLAWRLGKRWVLAVLFIVAAISLLIAHWASLAKPAAAFYLLPARGWELLIGVFAALYLSRSPGYRMNKILSEAGSVFGLLLIALAIFYFDRHTPFPSLYTLVPTVGTVLIILLATPETAVGRLLCHRLFVGIGLVSYSAYLWHQPLFAFARQRSLGEPDKLLLSVLVVTSFVLAYVSWKYVETPFRNRQRFSRRQIFAFGFLGSFFFASIGMAGHYMQGFPFRIDEKTRLVALAANDINPRREECLTGGEKYIRPENSCVIGSGPNIVGALLGDSHADAVAGALDEALGKKRIGLKAMMFIGCPPILNIFRDDSSIYAKCDEYNGLARDYLFSNKGLDHVVFVTRWTHYLGTPGFDNTEGGVEPARVVPNIDLVESGIRIKTPRSSRKELLIKKYIETIELYLSAGKKVILVYPIPEVGWNVPNEAAKQIMFGANTPEGITTSLAVYRLRHKEVIDAFDSLGARGNLFRIRPDAILCDTIVKGRCITQLDGIPLYYDDDHLSNAGARLIAEEILKYTAD